MADPVETLKSYTLYGCLLCGVVLTKIGKFTITSNLNLRLQCCLAASTMFSALFTCSMNHPQRLYDFGEYVPVEIWEGVNIFADPYKCSVLDLLEGLHFASSYLMANERFLEALPMLSLYEYAAYHIRRDPKLTALARCLRARALCGVGNLPGAARLLCATIQGENVPGVQNSNDRIPLTPDDVIGPDIKTFEFLPAELPGSTANKPVIDFIMSTELSSVLEGIYGTHVMDQLQVARATFLFTLGQVPNQWNNTTPLTGRPKEGDEASGEQEGIALKGAMTLCEGIINSIESRSVIGTEGEGG
eukprot:CAMPEP_0197855252 /NCGR_PEP_ID=MMETSP1438-20131217/26249_1 /TAXON_ID=1461541 /ORGANISM="Pterosperma sp., Strain CCMP1384" /LENGTH=302 /DNA_ID=CAMNT_0043470289 /DNA_START=80 /DNA_END=984 /DNA_ORIENTATION=-